MPHNHALHSVSRMSNCSTRYTLNCQTVAAATLHVNLAPLQGVAACQRSQLRTPIHTPPKPRHGATWGHRANGGQRWTPTRTTVDTHQTRTPTRSTVVNGGQRWVNGGHPPGQRWSTVDTHQTRTPSRKHLIEDTHQSAVDRPCRAQDWSLVGVQNCTRLEFGGCPELHRIAQE